ncbi:MAG TPA: 50S ribosomal protein L11 methyltransferase [Bacteroidota bacterium]|nr:50S ribosomal protein L11 methyltransferase [Bacteroidota bacterium]
MATPKRWKEIVFYLSEPYQDLLIGQLGLMGFQGFQQEEETLSAFIDGKKWNREKEEELVSQLGRFRREFPETPVQFTTKDIKEENWNLRWERSTGIVEATNRIIIKPSWAKLRVKDRGKIVIHIDPKMSFGTGHHATTRLCLELLERYLQPTMRVLDFGAGTGILSIAAVKLGASQAVAVDNDPWSITNARENIDRNNVERMIKLLSLEKPTERLGTFDIVVANIDLPTIKSLLDDFLQRVKANGFILLSGLLQTDLASFMDFIEGKGVVPIEVLAEDEWAAIALTAPYAHSRN